MNVPSALALAAFGSLSTAVAQPLTAYVLGTTPGAIERGPCPRAWTFRTDDGQRFEIEPLPASPAGGRTRIGGVIYPEASICGRYPWLRWDRQGERGGISGVDFARSSVQAWVDAARTAADRAQANLPMDWSDLLEIDLEGPLATLRALARSLAGRSNAAGAPGAEPPVDSQR
jgi:hypothetical protein